MRSSSTGGCTRAIWGTWTKMAFSIWSTARKTCSSRAGRGALPAGAGSGGRRRLPAERRGKDAEARHARTVLGRAQDADMTVVPTVYAVETHGLVKEFAGFRAV